MAFRISSNKTIKDKIKNKTDEINLSSAIKQPVKLVVITAAVISCRPYGIVIGGVLNVLLNDTSVASCQVVHKKPIV